MTKEIFEAQQHFSIESKDDITRQIHENDKEIRRLKEENVRLQDRLRRTNKADKDIIQPLREKAMRFKKIHAIRFSAVKQLESQINEIKSANDQKDFEQIMQLLDEDDKAEQQ